MSKTKNKPPRSSNEAKVPASSQRETLLDERFQAVRRCLDRFERLADVCDNDGSTQMADFIRVEVFLIEQRLVDIQSEIETATKHR